MFLVINMDEVCKGVAVAECSTHDMAVVEAKRRAERHPHQRYGVFRLQGVAKAERVIYEEVRPETVSTFTVA